jgi:hypothetical protein
VDYYHPPYQDGRAAPTLQVVVSSAAQSMLERSPTEAFRVEVVDEMVSSAAQSMLERSHTSRSPASESVT